MEKGQNRNEMKKKDLKELVDRKSVLRLYIAFGRLVG